MPSTPDNAFPIRKQVGRPMSELDAQDPLRRAWELRERVRHVLGGKFPPSQEPHARIRKTVGRAQ